ncbi:MAG: DUF4301 family protein [Tannerella sp.]|jgi:hypothetical protein|nr:DUF4301 family protein [Tannerella sp.]
MELTIEDRQLLSEKGISEEQLAEQLACFRRGFPFMEIVAPASLQKGIMRLTDEECDMYIKVWDTYRAGKNRSILKFVPASGAASRMFKDLYAFLAAEYDTPQTAFEKEFFTRITHFAFCDTLNERCREKTENDLPSLLAAGRYREIAGILLEKDGLGYGTLPKGVLWFHRYADGPRTALGEHLAEGAMYASNAAGEVTIHLTVSPEHQPFFKQLVKARTPYYEQRYGVKYTVSWTVQSPSTDTVAVETDNTPFRNADGTLLFRPGGHGALLENLNRTDADVVFIKNIDNVVPDHLKSTTVAWKKALAGILVDVQSRIFAFLRRIEAGDYTHEEIAAMIHFLQTVLCVKDPEMKFYEDAELILYIRRKLRRPLRVCGMVRNVGEPGGGPFLAVGSDGAVSLQIVESSQIDMSDPQKKALFEQSGHFNPVDLVCALKDPEGRKYHLPDFVDRNTGFISRKSKDGRELKALELPGLWNGAMSNWNTVFVEVPLATFNPVKTVNDLLRPPHQPEAAIEIQESK